MLRGGTVSLHNYMPGLWSMVSHCMVSHALGSWSMTCQAMKSQGLEHLSDERVKMSLNAFDWLH